MSETSPLQTVIVEKREKAVIATINAKMLDERELRVLGTVLDQAASDSGISHLVINLERVQLVPSLALGLLLRISQKCAEGSRALTITGLSPVVRRTFAITKLDQILTLADNVDAALAG